MTPPLETGLAPLMGIPSPPARSARDRKGEAKGEMRGVAVGAETDFATGENGNRGQGKVGARLPCAIDAKGSLAYVDVAGTTGSVAVAAVDAGSADQTVQALLDRLDGVHGTDKDPYLDHRARFPIVGVGLEAGGDDNAQGILVEDEAVQRAPPIQRDCSQSPLMMMVARIASQKRAARMHFARGFMI